MSDFLRNWKSCQRTVFYSQDNSIQQHKWLPKCTPLLDRALFVLFLISHNKKLLRLLSLNDSKPITSLDFWYSWVGDRNVLVILLSSYGILLSDFTPLVYFVDSRTNGMSVTEFEILNGITFLDRFLIKSAVVIDPALLGINVIQRT